MGFPSKRGKLMHYCLWGDVLMLVVTSPLRFVSFNQTATVDAVLGYLIAFLVLLSTVKLWHLLRLNPKLNMITSTLQRAWGDISGFVTVIIIMFLAYSIAVSHLWLIQCLCGVFACPTLLSLKHGKAMMDKLSTFLCVKAEWYA